MAGVPLTQADNPLYFYAAVGFTMYYGNCEGRGTLHDGGCNLPLRITTSIYETHSDVSFGPQQWVEFHGVPAVIYNGGDNIELYTDRMDVDIAADYARPCAGGGEGAAPVQPHPDDGLAGVPAAVLHAEPAGDRAHRTDRGRDERDRRDHRDHAALDARADALGERPVNVAARRVWPSTPRVGAILPQSTGERQEHTMTLAESLALTVVAILIFTAAVIAVASHVLSKPVGGRRRRSVAPPAERASARPAAIGARGAQQRAREQRRAAA